MKKQNNSQKGFTIIELLVIISILGLISSVALANLNEAREKARTAAAAQFDATVRHTIGDTGIGYWDFNDGAANDSSGNGNNGTIVGNHSFVSPGYDGTGSALYLDGGYVEGSLYSFPQSGITISGWVNPQSNVNLSTIISVGTGGGTTGCEIFSLSILSGKAAVKNTQASQPLQNNVWSHVLASFDSDGDAEIYVNGSPAGTVTNARSDCGQDWSDEGEPAGNELDTWVIGRPIGSESSNFQGKVDAVALYESSVNAKEAAKIYAENARKYKLADK